MTKPLLIFKLRNDVLDQELETVRAQVDRIFPDYTTAVFRVGDIDIEHIPAQARTFVRLIGDGGDPVWVRDDQILAVRQNSEYTAITVAYRPDVSLFSTDDAQSILDKLL